MYSFRKHFRNRKRSALVRRPQFERMEERVVYAVGDLDVSFGAAGLVRTSIAESGQSSEQVIKVLPRGDGGFYVAGRVADGRGWISAVWSFAGDGSLTTTFGNGGRALVPLGSGNEFLTDVAIAPDGKLVLAGYVRDSRVQAFSTPAFSRLNVNGTVDTTFGEKGITFTPYQVHAGPSAIVIRPTGEIVALIRTNQTYDLIQLDTSGAVDETFQTSGKPGLTFDTDPDALLLQADGSLIVALSRTVNDIDNDISAIVLKHSLAGVLDTAFGTNGLLQVSIGSSVDGNPYESPLRLKSAANSSILLAGTDRVGESFDLFVTKIKATGAIDTSFGTAGKVSLGLQGDSGTALHDLEVKSDGSLVVTGTQNYFLSNNDSVIAWYLTSGGQPDTTNVAQAVSVLGINTFGSSGDATLVGSRLIYATDTAAFSSNPTDIQLLAIKANGQLDTGFDQDGVKLLTGDNTLTNTRALDVLRLPDNSVLTLVHSSVPNSQGDLPLALIHYSAAGVMDTSYGTSGKLWLKNYTPWIGNLVPRLIATSFGNFVVEQQLGQLTIGKLTSSYLLDTSFGDNGWMLLDVSNIFQDVSDVLLTETSIILAGQKPSKFVSGTTIQSHAVARMDWDGQLVSQFGDQGVVDLPLRDFVQTFGVQLGLLSTGELLVLRDNDPNDSIFTINLTRLTEQGQIDSSFGTNGRLLTGFSGGHSLDSRRKLIVLPDDSFLVMGAIGQDFNIQIGIEKRTAAGALIEDFGQGGLTLVPDTSYGQELYDMAIDSQDRIVVSSAVVDQFSTAVQVSRFLADGQLDTEFSEDGSAVYPFGPFGEAMPTLVIADYDDIIIAGGETTLTTTQSLVARIIGSQPDPSLWSNQWTAEDINGDRLVSALDALLIINRLNTQTSSELPTEKDVDEFLDVNDDGFTTAFDALLVINRLNSKASGEGEGAAQVASPIVARTSGARTEVQRLPSAFQSPMISAKRLKTFTDSVE